jgi:hypothetical protein
MELQKNSNGIYRELALKEADRRWKDASELLKYATDYAQAGLKGLFLANGAAIIALLTFIGNTKEPEFDPLGIWWAFAWFTFGLVAVLATNILGYVSQASYMNAILSSSRQADAAAYETGHSFDSGPAEQRANRAEYAGIGMAISSLILFVSGAFVALDAIT